jgi:integrase
VEPDSKRLLNPEQQFARPGAKPRVRRPDPYAADDLFQEFREFLAGGSFREATARTWTKAIRGLLHRAAKAAGHIVTIEEIFRDPVLLGRALDDDTPLQGGGQLSRHAIDSRRGATQALAKYLGPELRRRIGRAPREVVEEALRGVTERIGRRYRVTSGRPRRRVMACPSTGDVRAVVEVVRREPGFRGARNLAFLNTIANTGIRLTALRTLRGDAVFRVRPGVFRLLIKDKQSRDTREVELRGHGAALLDAYIDARNHEAKLTGEAQVGPGIDGWLWVNGPRGAWGEAAIRRMLRDGCAVAQVATFTPHSLRRRYATRATANLPRATVAQAGGWSSVQTMDRHYVTPGHQDGWDLPEPAPTTRHADPEPVHV